MIINNAALLALLVLIAITYSQTTEVTYGCIFSSSHSVVNGNYTKYIEWESHSIWIQKVIAGPVYVIYFNDAMGANMYKAFGLYGCDNEKIYTSQVAEMSVKNPDGIMGCIGIPILFCPALNEDDSSTLVDGMNAADGKLDWIDGEMKDFYNCTHWFEYNEEANYPTGATLTFGKNIWCASSNVDDNNGGSVVPGGKYNPSSDTQKKNRMSNTALAILWSIVGAFILFCIVAIVYYIVKLRERKIANERARNESTIGLTEENEEDKFDIKPSQKEEISTPILSGEEDNDQVTV